MALASSKEFLDIQATVECGFTLKLVRDMIKTYNQSKTKVEDRKLDIKHAEQKLLFTITKLFLVTSTSSA